MKLINDLRKYCPTFIKNIYHKIYPCITYPFYFIRYNKNQKKLIAVQSSIKESISKSKKIRIGFYIVFDFSWGSRPLFEKMQNDPLFEIKIVICPDVSRGEENQRITLETVYTRLANLYGNTNVLKSYDEKKGYIDYSDEFDLIGLANPYDEMTHPYYSCEYLTKKNKLVFLNAYGYQGKLKWDIRLMKLKSYNLLWKFFVDNEETKQLARKYQYIHGKNIVVSGSCKMDKLANNIVKKDDKKTIIIAPHHTVRQFKNGLNLSNFLRFAELIQELPKKYENVNFIFRPHPLLFITLSSEDLWGKQKVNEYFERLQKNSNLVYSTEGEYFDIFNESDALIDDCGSFLAEYFYTGKPQCYVLQNATQYEKEFINYGKQFFNYVYKAFTEDDIYNFIDNVVLQSNDTLMDKRNVFAKERVMINYPHVSDYILNYLKDQLL